jgi:adenosylcobinamide kinase/adenosylcobinamide-phosphate guanylyltransferase
VLGGARSGKSRHAEALLQRHAAPWCYIATAEALDDEMRARIALHRERRPAGWHTIEAPHDLAGALGAAGAVPVLVDCLTLWTSNLLLADIAFEPAIAALLEALAARSAPTIMVANEVGLGIVPDNALAREFRDRAGSLNQRVAEMADQVLFMVAGLAMKVKPT